MGDFLSRLVDRNQISTGRVVPRPRFRFETRTEGESHKTYIDEPSDSIETELQSTTRLSSEKSSLPPEAGQVSQTQVATRHELHQFFNSIDTKTEELSSPLASHRLQRANTVKNNEGLDFRTWDTSDSQAIIASVPDMESSGSEFIQPRIDTKPDRRSLEPLPTTIDTERHSHVVEAPIIRVTIGRVEIRAVQPKVQQQPRSNTPSSRPGPKLSLDTYLQSRWLK